MLANQSIHPHFVTRGNFKTDCGDSSHNVAPCRPCSDWRAIPNGLTQTVNSANYTLEIKFLGVPVLKHTNSFCAPDVVPLPIHGEST